MELKGRLCVALAVFITCVLPVSATAVTYEVQVDLRTPDINGDGVLDHAAGFNSGGGYTYIVNLEAYNASYMKFLVDETGSVESIDLHYEGVLVHPNGTQAAPRSIVDMEYRNDITLTGAHLSDEGVGAAQVAPAADSSGIWNNPGGLLGVNNIPLSGKANEHNQVFTGNFTLNPFQEGILNPDLLLGAGFFGQGWGKFTNAMNVPGFDLVAYGTVSRVTEIPDGEPVPEPSTLVLMGVSLLAARRKAQR